MRSMIRCVSLLAAGQLCEISKKVFEDFRKGSESFGADEDVCEAPPPRHEISDNETTVSTLARPAARETEDDPRYGPSRAQSNQTAAGD